MKNQNEQISNGRIIGYGLGSMGKDLALGVISSYLLAFYTDVFGITAAAAGVILFVAKIWDAINDPMMGTIADHSKRTKWGKYRPYVLIVPIPLAVFSALCFLTPNFGMAGKIAYAAITYTITGMLFTAYSVPLWGMVPSLSSEMNTRNKLIAASCTFTALAMLIASSAAMPAIQTLGGGESVENLRSGYPKFMLILGVVSVICALITFFSTKEVVYDDNNAAENQEGGVFKQFIAILNKPLILVILAMLFNAVNMVLPSVSGVYYMIYYMHRPDMIPIYMMVAMGTGLITNIIAPMILKKISARTLCVIAFAISIVVSIVVFLIGPGSLTLLFVLFAVCGLCTGILMVSITSLLTITSDFTAAKVGRRVDGVVFSMNSFAVKVGEALASVLVSVLLTITHYVPNAFEQAPAAETGILISRSILPGAVALLGLIFILLFKLPANNQVDEAHV